jgi:hypothetical protein
VNVEVIVLLANFYLLITKKPLTVDARSKAWTVFAPSNAGIVGSNPTPGMDVCLHLFCVCVRAAASQLRQDKHQDMRQKKQKLTSASWLRPVSGGFHNLIRFNCAPLFAPCRRHRVLTVTCLDACRCAAYPSLRVGSGLASGWSPVQGGRRAGG